MLQAAYENKICYGWLHVLCIKVNVSLIKINLGLIYFPYFNVYCAKRQE